MTETEAIAAGMTCMFTGEYYDSIEEAVDKANNHGGGTITLLADTVVSKNGKAPEMCFNSGFAIRSKKGGPTFRIYRGPLDKTEMLSVTDGTLRLFSVILDGTCEGGANRCAIRVSDLGKAELKDVVIRDNASDNAGNADNQGATAICVVGEKASLKLGADCVISGFAGTGNAISAIVASGGVIKNEGVTFENNRSENGANPNYTDLTGTTSVEGVPLG